MTPRHIVICVLALLMLLSAAAHGFGTRLVCIAGLSVVLLAAAQLSVAAGLACDGLARRLERRI